MPRYALKIEYNGHALSGWQRQEGHPSVQQAIEEALAKLEPKEHRIAAAGRTDAGVHATGQVAHCDMAQEWEPFRLSEALNYHLKPATIAIVAAARVDDDWHARFSAIERRYLYRIYCRRAPSAHLKGLVWQVKHSLDVSAMHSAAQVFLGQHDFTTFRSVMCQAKSPVKTLDHFEVRRAEGPFGAEIHFELHARSFLHNQVRSFVGTLERVGAGRWSREDVQCALEAQDRARCGPVAPPQGLYLTQVRYETGDPFKRA